MKVGAEHPPYMTDMAAFGEAYVTVTPLQFHLTDHTRLGEVAGWGLEL
jgi:broad specificity polyphosphatase/5'/3'-nucleotidase SurE